MKYQPETETLDAIRAPASSAWSATATPWMSGPVGPTSCARYFSDGIAVLQTSATAMHTSAAGPMMPAVESRITATPARASTTTSAVYT